MSSRGGGVDVYFDNVGGMVTDAVIPPSIAARASSICGQITRMMWVGFRSDPGDVDERPQSHSFWVLALTGLATSIDALAVGVGLAFVDVSIGWVAAAIGLATFTMVTVGVMLGRALGGIAGRRAEILGGLLLIGIGAAIVFEHLGATP